jgi:hypothetical protein
MSDDSYRQPWSCSSAISVMGISHCVLIESQMVVDFATADLLVCGSALSDRTQRHSRQMQSRGRSFHIVSFGCSGT